MKARAASSDFLSPVATKDLAGALARRRPGWASLIHDERPTGWADWLRSVGVEPNGTWHGTNFSDSDLALAAPSMQGVALGSLFLRRRHSLREALRPFDVPDAGGWYAISTQDRFGTSMLARLGIGWRDASPASLAES